MGGAFAFSPLSIPFIVVSTEALVLTLLLVLTRGNALIRASLAAVLLVGTPYMVGLGLLGSCNDVDTAIVIGKIVVGPISLLGPALMLMLFAMTGRLDKHRGLLFVATALSLVTCVVCWTTDLVINDAVETPWGFLYPQAGPLNSVHVGQFILWSIVGVVVARRGSRLERSARQRLHKRRLIAVIVVCIPGATDGILAQGYGVYPFSVIASAAALGVGIQGVLSLDLLQSRGLDRDAAYQLGLFAALVGIVLGSLTLLLATPPLGEPVVTALLLVPLLCGVQLGMTYIRRRSDADRRRSNDRSSEALDEFIELTSNVRREVEIVAALDLLATNHLGLSRVRLYRVDARGESWPVGGVAAEDADSRAPPLIDTRVRAWLVANSSVVVIEELSGMPLGGLRGPIEDVMASLDADIVVPLVNREVLVGLMLTAAPTALRALRDDERETLSAATDAAAKALTFLSLFCEAEERIEVAKEVEVAAAVQHARSAGEQRFDFHSCEVIGHYIPASQFGGHWWASHEMPDGRVLVVMGDVSGHGVSAALVSFTVEGACRTAQAMFGANMDVISLLDLLNTSVLDIGDDSYAMSCFAAVFDVENRRVTFANAGHPFPYVCRRPAAPNSKGAELRALVSRGTPLGTHEPILSVSSMDLEPDDVVVFYSESVVDSRNPEGESFGDRRFQRLLRGQVRAADGEACNVILDSAMRYYGDRSIEDDLSLVVVRLRGAA